MKTAPQQPRQIFLGNIAYDATPRDVVDALRGAGIGAARVRIATHQDTGSPRGFGFLDLDPGEARTTQEVIDYINELGVDLCGRLIRADMAKERPPRQEAERPKRPVRKPQGGSRGHARSEFQRPRNEFEWDD